jgi:hypothetical protein
MFPAPVISGLLKGLNRAGCLLVTLPLVSGAQEPVSNLGLPAVAAVGFHGGFARLERSSKGEEAGLLLDLGWVRGRSVRLQGEVAFLRATLTETLVVEDSTFHGDYFDLSAGVSAIWLASTDAGVSPYALVGAAVHALSSTFGNSVLDQRYNANRFGSHVGAGIRLRIGSSRQALFAEARRVIADHVDRTEVRFGGLVLMGDLYRRTTGNR